MHEYREIGINRDRDKLWRVGLTNIQVKIIQI